TGPSSMSGSYGRKRSVSRPRRVLKWRENLATHQYGRERRCGEERVAEQLSEEPPPQCHVRRLPFLSRAAGCCGPGPGFSGLRPCAASHSGRRCRLAAERRLDGVPTLAVTRAPEGWAVFLDGVDLPPLAVGRAGHPELVLLGIAAGALAFVDGGQAGLTEPGLL